MRRRRSVPAAKICPPRPHGAGRAAFSPPHDLCNNSPRHRKAWSKNMRPILFAAAALLLLAGSQSARAQEPVGTWLTEGGKSRIRIADCGGALCGTIAWLQEQSGVDKSADTNVRQLMRCQWRLQLSACLRLFLRAQCRHALVKTCVRSCQLLLHCRCLCCRRLRCRVGCARCCRHFVIQLSCCARCRRCC